MRRADTPGGALSCSFCQKSADSVSKLISSPSDYPRAYICDECIEVCAAILEGDRGGLAPESGMPVIGGERHPLSAHPLASSLLTAVERWIRRESLGGDAAEELAELRSVAVKMMNK